MSGSGEAYMPVGDRAKAIAMATATARELWQTAHVPTCVRVRDEKGIWRDESSFGEDDDTSV